MANRVLLGPTGGDDIIAVTVVSSSGNKFAFDGLITPNLALTLGGTYTFDQSHSSNSNHPLRFSTIVNGTHGGGAIFSTGITYNGTPGQAGAYTKVSVVSMRGYSTLYYYCAYHSGMGASATVSRIPDTVGLKISKPGVDVTTATQKDLLINTGLGKMGQVYAGGNISAVSNNATVNYLTVTGSGKPYLGYHALVLTREDAAGDSTISSSGNTEAWTDNVSHFMINPYVFKPTAPNLNISSISSGSTTWSPLDGGTRSQTVACTNLKYYVLRIPCGYGFMNSTYFG